MSHLFLSVVHMFDDVFDRVTEEVRALSPAGLSRGGLVDGLSALGRLRGTLDAVEARFAGAISQLGDRGADAAVVLRSATHCSDREAKKRSRRAETLAAMPNVSEGLEAGLIPVEAVDSLVRAAESAGAEAVDADTKLLDLVGSRPADMAAREIRNWTRGRQSSADLEKVLQGQIQERQGCWFTGDGGMVVVHAEFDPVAGAGALARLDAETDALWRSDGGRDGCPDDIRTPAQRRCDAVARLLGAASSHPPDNTESSPKSGRVVTTVVVVADVGVVDGTNPEGRCEILDSGPIPAMVLDHLPADTTWQGALFNGPGRPLWVGRSRRLANGSQRLMASVRDGGCVNCNAPTNRCHTHHVREWQEGGNTDLDMLVLLCPRCHTLLHEGHIRLHRQSDGTWVCRPTGRRPAKPG